MTRRKSNKEIFSFRSFLKEELSPLVSEFAQIEVASNILTDIVVFLAALQDEGNSLHPIIFLGEDLNEILGLTHGSDPLSVGSGGRNRETILRLFKQCAPLTEDRDWAIYVKLGNGKIDFGIFRTDPSPVHPTSFDRLRQASKTKRRTIGMSRLGRSFIEVSGGAKFSRIIDMSGDDGMHSHPKEQIRNFMRAVTKDVKVDLKSQIQSFYFRLAADILYSNHGTLLAVVPFRLTIPNLFRDGIKIEPKINMLNELKLQKNRPASESFHRLTGIARLIERMSSMDGVTIFDSQGSVVGYNCFVEPSGADRGRKVLIGGARRHAFDILRSNLGNNVDAVLYKSRDGMVESGVNRAKRS